MVGRGKAAGQLCDRFGNRIVRAVWWARPVSGNAPAISLLFSATDDSVAYTSKFLRHSCHAYLLHVSENLCVGRTAHNNAVDTGSSHISYSAEILAWHVTLIRTVGVPVLAQCKGNVSRRGISSRSSYKGIVSTKSDDIHFSITINVAQDAGVYC